MAEPRPIASLSPTLLARKGGARPAMRPQAVINAAPRDVAAPPATEEDLGWNDFGHPAPVSTPAPANDGPRRQRRAVSRRSALAQGGRAAFTLRLDEDRHLKLRLACTGLNRSAQMLVTEALDRLLDDMPELAPLAGQLRPRRSN